MEDSATNTACKDGKEEEDNICIIYKCDDANSSTKGQLNFLGHVQGSQLLQLQEKNCCLLIVDCRAPHFAHPPSLPRYLLSSWHSSDPGRK